MSAGIQFSGYLDGHSQGVYFTQHWPNTLAVNWSVQCAYATFGTAIVGSNPRMGLVLPVGAEPGDNNTTQTYFFLIQNAGDLAGVFDLVFQFEQF